MVTYPNQKVITVKKNACNKENTYLQIRNDNWHIACSTLTYGAFKLYLYMASNNDGYTFALSYEAINREMPMSRDTYDRAIRDLKKSGYLQHDGGNQWIFRDAV